MMNPHMHIIIDGEQRAEWDVRGDWLTYPQSVPLLKGKHTVSIDNFDNYRGATKDRTLVVDWVSFSMPTLEGTPRVPAGGFVVVDAEDIHNSVTGQLERSSLARNGTMWLQWGVGCFVEMFVAEAGGAHEVDARLKGNVHDGVGTRVQVRVDSAQQEEYFVGEDWEQKRTRFEVDTGPHTVEICYDNDEAGQKRNLWLDEMALASLGPGSPAAPVEGAPWLSAHGGLANHRYAPSALDAQSILTAREAWSYRAGAVTGTPAHDEGVLYFADFQGVAHAVRADDGSAVWTATLPAGVDSSAALDAENVYFGDMDGHLIALRRSDGIVAWSVKADEVEGTHLYGSPVVHEGVLYTGVASEQTLIEYTGPQTFRGSVAAFSASDGRLLWRTYTQQEGGAGVSVWSTPALDPDLGLLFVGTGNSYGEPVGEYTDSILALRMSDGRVEWHFQATKNDAFNARGGAGPDRDFGASPILFSAGGRDLVGEGDKGGRFFALERATGELVWNATADFKVDGVPPSQVEGFLGSASYHDGVIYAPTTARSMVTAIDAATGGVLWDAELNPLPTKYGDRMFGPSTAAEGIVLQGNAFGRTFALDMATGDVLANLSAGGAVQGGIVIAGDLLVVPDVGKDLWSGSGGLVAYRVTPGAPQTGGPGSPGATPPTLGDPAESGSGAIRDAIPAPGVLALLLTLAFGAAGATRRQGRR
jgi:polyvinyl alcohol dehydrogenase (cytochrome)